MTNGEIKIKRKFLNELDLNDEFFGSLKEDYFNFSEWFRRKGNEVCYLTEEEGKITSFLLLKTEDENEDYDDFFIPFTPGKRLKVCTFKVDDTGKGIGDEFLNIVFAEALKEKVLEIYLTVFDKHIHFINMIKKNGFLEFTQKRTLKKDGKIELEKVFAKRMGGR